MKTPSDELFQLIKSLDPQEKVYFKVYASRKAKNNNYIKLFNAIDSQTAYDEISLKQIFKNNALLRNFKRLKSYATEAILNSLQEYHSDISANIQVQKLLHQAEVLVKKKLTGHAKKILLKAKQVALEYELYDCLISICSLETRILHSTRNTKEMKDYLNHGAIQAEKYAERVQNIIKFRNLVSQVQLIGSTYATVQGREHVHKINSILNSPLLTSPDKALTFSSLKDYYFIHLTCSLILNMYDNAAYQRQKEWVSYLESDKTKFAERTDIYLGALANLMAIHIKNDRTDEAEKLYEKIKYFYFSLPPKKRTKDLLSVFINATSHYMATQNVMGNAAKSLKAWEQIKGYVSLNMLNPDFFLVICYNLFDSYFTLGNYQNAMQWLNKILNFKEKNFLELQATARINLLLIQYELGNYDMLPYTAKSTQRFLVKHGYFAEFEKIMVGFFEKQIHKTNYRQKQSEAFIQLKKEVGALLKNKKQIPIFEHFHYLSWIESKIENRSFVEIVRQKGGSGL